MKGFNLSITFLLCICVVSKAQSISPFTLNIGGLTGGSNGYSLTISAGETISITNFTTPMGVSLSSGFLQANPPLVTGIDELITSFNPNEIDITPNPVKTVAYLNANLKGGGKLQFQIVDIGSRVIYRSPVFSTFGFIQNQIDFSNFSTGQYYVRVYFIPTTGKPKSGIYKIIKL